MVSPAGLNEDEERPRMTRMKGVKKKSGSHGRARMVTDWDAGRAMVIEQARAGGRVRR
jgi:hypothetical protein